MRWWPLLLLAGCMTLARTKGAKTLERGQVEFGAGAPAIRTHEDPLFPYPVPQGGFEMRVGTGNNVDIGFQGYLLGVGADVRYRFFHTDRLHLAVAPGFGMILQPNLLSNLSDLGGFEGKLPLIGEAELTRWFNVSGGPQAVFRQRLNTTLDGSVWRFDLWTGAGLRAEAHGGIFAIGASADVFYVPTRFTKRPVWVAGLDLKFRSRTKAEANARAAKRGRAARWPEHDKPDPVD